MSSESYGQFLERVKQRTYLSDVGAASSCMIATLKTLGEHLSQECTVRIALHVPEELRVFLLSTGYRPKDYSITRFFLSVSIRENSTYISAVYHARCVLEVLTEAIPASEL